MRKRLGWRFNHRHSVPDWIEHRADGLRYARRVLVTRPQNLIGYWPMWEGNGGVSFDNSPQGNDGAYVGVTLAQLGAGDGRYSPFFDGANDFNNVLSAGLVAAFDGDEGTIIGAARVFNAGVWTDGLNRVIARLTVDGNNFVILVKLAAANNIQYRRRGSGDAPIQITVTATLDWFWVGMTWSRTADQVIYYLNGIQTGAIDVGLGAFVGNPGIAVIGANNLVPIQAWHGWLAHTSLYNAALTPAEIAFLSEPLRM